MIAALAAGLAGEVGPNRRSVIPPNHRWSVLNVGTFPSVGGTGSAYCQGRGSLGRSDHDTRSGR